MLMEVVAGIVDPGRQACSSFKRFSSTFSNRDARDASMDKFIDSVIAQATA